MVRYIVHLIFIVLPPMHFNVLKCLLLRISGVKVKGCTIVSSAKFYGRGPILIGNGTFIGHNTSILAGSARISIESNVDVSSNVLIINGSHQIDLIEEHRVAGKGFATPIVIKKGAWIGAGSVILGGVTIGERCIIGAGSVVTKSMPAGWVCFGNPCKPQRTIGVYE